MVILSTGQLDDVLALGLVPIGAATANDADLVPEYLKTKFSDKSAELDKIAKVGKRTEPDLGAIANLHPDLILINNTNKKGRGLRLTLKDRPNCGDRGYRK